MTLTPCHIYWSSWLSSYWCRVPHTTSDHTFDDRRATVRPSIRDVTPNEIASLKERECQNKVNGPAVTKHPTVETIHPSQVHSHEHWPIHCALLWTGDTSQPWQHTTNWDSMWLTTCDWSLIRHTWWLGSNMWHKQWLGHNTSMLSSW